MGLFSTQFQGLMKHFNGTSIGHMDSLVQQNLDFQGLAEAVKTKGLLAAPKIFSWYGIGCMWRGTVRRRFRPALLLLILGLFAPTMSVVLIQGIAYSHAKAVGHAVKLSARDGLSHYPLAKSDK